MSGRLPKGFDDSNYEDTPSTESDKKCRLGLQCYGGEWNQCRFHKWTWLHDEAWAILQVLALVAVITAVVIVALEYDWQVRVLPERAIVDGYNCNQLAEYIADKSQEYSYAEHRYEWLCVNEKVQEFQK